MKNHKLNSIFNLEDSNTSNELVEKKEAETVSSIIEDHEDLKELRKIRDNLSSYTNIGETALQELLEVAVQSQSPRAYEVLGQMIRALTDVNKEMGNQISENLNRKTTQVNENYVTNNNLYISTDELLDKLIEKKEKE